jgi:hypothetical protein
MESKTEVPDTLWSIRRLFGGKVFTVVSGSIENKLHKNRFSYLLSVNFQSS